VLLLHSTELGTSMVNEMITFKLMATVHMIVQLFYFANHKIWLMN